MLSSSVGSPMAMASRPGHSLRLSPPVSPATPGDMGTIEYLPKYHINKPLHDIAELTRPASAQKNMMRPSVLRQILPSSSCFGKAARIFNVNIILQKMTAPEVVPQFLVGHLSPGLIIAFPVPFSKRRHMPAAGHQAYPGLRRTSRDF